MKEFTIRPLFDIYSIGLYSEDRLCSPLGTNLGIRDTEDTKHLALYERCTRKRSPRPLRDTRRNHEVSPFAI